MVYKRYIIKNGKRHGPYYYESYREGDKIRKRYIGNHLPAARLRAKRVEQPAFSSRWFLFVFLIAVMAVFAWLWYTPFSTTGKVVVEVNATYTEGAPIDGTVKFTLQPGELIPKDARVRATLGEQQKEKILSELVNVPVSSGELFAQGTGVQGQGEGYGTLGTRTTQPTVGFTFEITRGGGQEGGGGEKHEEKKRG